MRTGDKGEREGDELMGYRAAVWNSDDGQGEVILTLPEQSGWSDEALLVEAGREMERTGLNGGKVTLQYVTT